MIYYVVHNIIGLCSLNIAKKKRSGFKIRKIVYSIVGTEISKKGARVDCRYYLI